MIEKKDRDKRYIKNWWPISLLNLDAKLLSKALAARLKTVLPTIIKHDQTAYVANRCLGESVRLISDVLETAELLNLDGYLMTIDIEKAFDSVDHCFLFAALEKLGFEQNFVQWIKIMHNKQESCVMNGGNSTGYFSLERGSRQGDPISAYLFIIIMEVFFSMVRNNQSIKGMDILGKKFILTSYADDTTFFTQDLCSTKEILITFDIFSKYSGLSINKSKCEIAGIGTKNGAQVALWDIKCVNLRNESIQILGVHFSYNKQIILETNFTDVVQKIENVVSVWRWRNLTLSGKITIFNSLAFSKMVFLSFLSNIPAIIIEKLEKIQKYFIWNNKRPKVKHTTLI